jgi:hypothetical protein
MAHAAVKHYSELKNKLKHLGGRRGYTHYKETFMPDRDIEEDVNIDELRERFVKKIYDDRFTEALPYVYRAYKNQQKLKDNSLTQEFESWANDIAEGTWSLPDTDEKIENLDEIMSAPIEAGIDGSNATSVLYHLIGDDELFDNISELADATGPDADVRPLVVDWLTVHNPELARKYQAPTETVPQQLDQKTAPTATESRSSLDFMRSLANILK